MVGCDVETKHPATIQSTKSSEMFAELIPESTQTLDGIPAERHLTLPSGLRIDEYALQDAPEVEPLTFVPFRGSQQEIMSQHEVERSFSYLNNSFLADRHFSMSADFADQELVARAVVTSNSNMPGQIAVEVMLDDTIIFNIPAGNVSPLPSLQGLWTYDGHWYVEIATVEETYDDVHNEVTFQALGHIIKDGDDLDQRNAYQEMFGFQLLNGKPFNYFNLNGEIGVEFDNQETFLGYESVPHYGCCSAGALNPKPAKNMVSFFAQKDGYWYYVEIGVFE